MIVLINYVFAAIHDQLNELEQITYVPVPDPIDDSLE